MSLSTGPLRCALYPADPEFLSDVRQEIQEQVLRIGHHPSIALWGGNNENEWSLTWCARHTLPGLARLVDNNGLSVYLPWGNPVGCH
jgi:beta-galactosidase/beta-glucuronidase